MKLKANAEQIAFLNKILLIIVILLLLYLVGGIATYIFSTPELSSNYTQVSFPRITPPPPSSHFSLSDSSSYNCVREGRLFKLPVGFLSKPKGEDVVKIDFVLDGIVWGVRSAVAILKKTGSGEIFLVKVGEKLNDLKITKITQNSVILEKGGREVVLELEYPPRD
jgi:type II secretory pathway component PulC